MIDDLIKLKEKFDIINKMGWIKSMRNGSTGSGYTFETLIGKKEEQFPVPDFGTIEIKTKNISSDEWMTLFNATPDGDFIFPAKGLYEKYGFPDKKNPCYKVFYAAVFSYPNYAGKNYRFRLSVNREKKELRLLAIDRAGKIEDTHTSWSFDFLNEKLNCKIKYLAIVMVRSIYMHGIFYYKYESINFYMLKDFKTFINLIESGLIKITFKIGFHSSGNKLGEMYNHGTGFDINLDNIEKLYYKVC